ncbi:LamG-like jellyroll fold domain-containing protein [Actinomadura oligospora]|uniref:LamG-like jellyroll fold domain-containing protein n=1 Tax=Actinomadura oligospora TaxID=111804 RepID=UPI0004B37775|nr:LamG-like jellyroll fold domain-containing protein [Actinomadura oligospora]
MNVRLNRRLTSGSSGHHARRRVPGVPRPSRRSAALAGGVALATAVAGAIVLVDPQHSATVSSTAADSAATPPTVSADPLPTWQVNGVVWSMATVGDTVYAAGKFTKARPPGAAPGTQEVDRQNLLAFSLSTGELVKSFDHKLDGQGLRVVASPDGKRVYVGGEFTAVDGRAHTRLAAFDTASGALVDAFKPDVSNKVRGIAATDSTVYFGGNFFNVNGQGRTRLAAVRASDGSNLPWAPKADDDEVFALAIAPKGGVLVGGRFQTINGEPHVGVGQVDPSSGATLPFEARPIPSRQGTNFSYVTDLQVQGDTVFGAADGEGHHWYDGRFAAKADDGKLVWLDNCYGATYSMLPRGKTVYSVSHAHDCSSTGDFRETSPVTWHRTLAETADPTGVDHSVPGSNSNYNRQPVPSLMHWFPTLLAGTFTGQGQAAWAITGSDDYIALGGEFPSVNGNPQQGLVRFASRAKAPNKTGPRPDGFASPAAPTATSLPGGRVRVNWQTTWDMDDPALTYEVYRDGNATTPVGSVTRTSTFWKRPTIAFVDKTAAPGVDHTYSVKVKDPSGNSTRSAVSNAARPGDGKVGWYTDIVAADGAAGHWRLGEASGKVMDYAGGGDLTAGSGVSRDAQGAIAEDDDHAGTFDGSSAGTAGGAPTPAPDDLTLEAWVRTTSTSGGKIVGFGDKASGLSSTYDRQLYMTGDGSVMFGVYDGQTKTVRSKSGLNDGKWHHVAATLGSSAGMKLFVDGEQESADADTTFGQNYDGYWRIGGDNLASWPQAGSSYFKGDIDEVAYYPSALTSAVLHRHFAVGTGLEKPNVPPVAAFDPSCAQLSCTFDAAKSTDADGSIKSYTWDFGDKTTGTGVKPVHLYQAAGSYTVKLKVTDDKDVATEFTGTVAVKPQNLVTDGFARTVASGWGSTTPGGAWTVYGGTFSTSGGVGWIKMTKTGALGGAGLKAVSSASNDLTFQVSSDRDPSGAGVAAYGTPRTIAATGEYRARVRMAAGKVYLRLSRTNAAGAETAIGSEKAVAGIAFKAWTRLRVRVQAVGTAPTTLRAKVWVAGQSEPAAWTLSMTDTTAALQRAGGVGVRAYTAKNTAVPVRLSLDDLRADRLAP